MRYVRKIAFALALTVAAAALLTLPASAQDSRVWRQPNADLSLTILDTGRIAMPDSYAYKGGPDTKQDWPILAFLVQHPNGTVLIDAGCNPAFATGKAKEYVGFIYPLANLIFDLPQMTPGQDVGSQLGALGIDPASINAVIATHGHIDHIGGVASLPTSVPVYMGEGEVPEFSRWNADLNGFHKMDIETGNDFRTVPWEAHGIFGFGRTWDYFGDGSMVLIEAPGHTPGSLMVLLNLESQPILLTGDAVYFKQNYEIPAPKGNLFLHKADSDATRAMQVIERVRAISEEHPDVLLLLSHDVAQFSSLKIAPEVYR